MDLSQYAELFLAESREHLSACNQLLLELEKNPAARDPVGGIFRAMHTIKGMAATMGYGRVADLAHRAESLLDSLRAGSSAVSDGNLQLLFRTVDALEQAVALSVTGRERDLDVSALAAELERAVGAGGTARETAPRPSQPVAPPAEPAVSALGRLIEVTLRENAQLKGGRSLIALAKARALGTVRAIAPPVEAFEAEDFDGHFTFRLETAAAAALIVQAIERAGDVEQVTVAEEEAAAPAAEAATLEPGRRHLRVDLRRLDALMDLIGELVIARGRRNDLAAARRDPEVDDVALNVSRLSRDLQDQIIQARMTPVWQVFDRFPRLVRDSARQLGKQVSLRVEGKEIELDRTILDELGDPLIHILRNAVDHGIESPEDRRRAGKKPEGEIVLSAVRERSSVMITITDDGRGIARAKVLERAKREGLVDPNAESITDDQLLRIIQRPGFTTADAVTSVSGRGVGIDVAVTRLRALGGTVEVRS
jgi:two-component system, chemotaxis family, sensor kinase CheA